MEAFDEPSKQISSSKRWAVLFVDDEEGARKYFRRACANDYPVFVADSVGAAESVLAEHAPSIAVVVTDQRMLGRTGMDLLQLLAAQHPTIVRVVTTAYAEINSSVESLSRTGKFRYIPKPWDLSTLRDAVREAMDEFFERQREQALLEGRRKTLLSVAGSIVHELRTPLVCLRAAATVLQQSMPALLDTYKQARSRGESLPPLSVNSLGVLNNLADIMASEVEEAQTTIDMLLANARADKIDTSRFTTQSLIACVENALRRYPFQTRERILVRTLQSEDFSFHGCSRLFAMVLFNLLKNALHAISAAGQGEICIEWRRGEKFNTLRFRDTGSGIAKADLPFIFDDFFSLNISGEGNGLGLPFCRKVMQSFGGTIDCISQEGVFTEFILTLPLLTER